MYGLKAFPAPALRLSALRGRRAQSREWRQVGSGTPPFSATSNSRQLGLNAMAKLTLFGAPGSRAQIIEWAALELGASFEDKTLSRAELKAQPYLSIHPFGKIPAIACDDETPIFESGAILLYLADKFDTKGTPESRGAAASWVVWANASFWPAMEGGDRASKLPALLGPVNTLLGTRTWLCGDNFTVADVAVGAYVKYTVLFFRVSLAPYKNLVRYMAEIEARPHFQSTVAAG